MGFWLQEFIHMHCGGGFLNNPGCYLLLFRMKKLNEKNTEQV